MPHRPSRQYWPEQAATPFLQNAIPSSGFLRGTCTSVDEVSKDAEDASTSIEYHVQLLRPRRYSFYKKPNRRGRFLQEGGFSPATTFTTLYYVHPVLKCHDFFFKKNSHDAITNMCGIHLLPGRAICTVTL